MDEALTGLKSALAVKIYGPDLNVLQTKALDIKRRLEQVPGFTELTVVRELGQPSLLIDVDRDKIARYGINVADVEAIVQAAIGGQAATQVIQGEKLFDLVVRMKPEFRENAAADRQPAGRHALGPTDSSAASSRTFMRPAARRSSIAKTIRAISACSTAWKGATCKAPCSPASEPSPTSRNPCHPATGSPGAANTASCLRPSIRWNSLARSLVLIIFMILFALYGNFKFPFTIALGVMLTEPVGALIALKLTHTPFSVSSALGLLALMGVSVETAVILVSYINKLRLENKDIRTATREASLLRLRPIMMTALVACLGLLPAALSTGIGSDTQKPFAIVIVAGLVSRLFLGFFVNPVLIRDGGARRRCPAGVILKSPKRETLG